MLLVQIVHMHHIVYCYMTHPLKNDMTDGGGRLNFGEGRGFPSTTDKQLISHDYLVELYLGLDQA